MRAAKYIALGLGLIGVAALVYYGNSIPTAGVVLSKLPDFQAKAIDLYADSLKLLNSFALLIVGGVGFFVQLMFGKDTQISITRWFRLLLVLAVTFAGVSLVFGYESYANLIEAVGIGLNFRSASPRLAYFHRLQFWTFGLSVASFAAVSIHALFDRSVQGKQG